MMEKQLQRRLQELRAEFDAGQRMLAELEAKQASTRDTLLRISGAIQVLEELVNHEVVASQSEEEADDPALRLVKTG